MDVNRMPLNNFGEKLQKLDDISTFLAMVGLILAIQSTKIDRASTSNDKTDKRMQSKADKIIIVSVFIAACSNFIDLSTAKATYDQLLEQDPKATPEQLSAVKDLLTSRVFSAIAAIYLIRATLKSQNLVEGIGTSVI